jgi:carboxymethylenebutenolidase
VEGRHVHGSKLRLEVALVSAVSPTRTLRLAGVFPGELGSRIVCFELDSVPPIPVIRGAAVSHEDLVLEAADGNKFAAFAATPEESGVVGVVILPDVRGLYRFYEELALRFAERGIAAVALDYFGRTAGVSKRGDDFEYMEHVAQTTPEGIQADVRAAVEYLRSNGVRSVFTVGFCFGGRNSWLAAAGRHGLAGAIGFYGRPGEGRDGTPGPAQLASELDAPILGLQAGADQSISAEDNAAFEEALTAAGVEHELVTYDGAPHSFFDRTQEQFAAASEDAWGKVLAFIEHHSHRPNH